MKKQDLEQLKNLSIKELVQKANSLKEEIPSLVMDKNMNKLKDSKAIFKTKKNLSQTLTILTQKKSLQDLESVDKKEEKLEEKTAKKQKVKGEKNKK
ncbi:50S ribosomal protein L29 [Candidatus Daviesbacteria bacterium]|nr:50S ribosomal protein L29 [Candidatus Daviesbacteria bacterium]